MSRTIVITGGTGGIGYQSALGIARAATTATTIVITGRNQERGEDAVRRLQAASTTSSSTTIHLVVGSVSSIAQVDALAAGIGEKVSRVDVLVNNAGYIGGAVEKNEDGIEMHFAVNVVAPWRLTQKLLPLLQKADHARVINVTGGGMAPAAVDVDNLQAEKGFKGMMTYSHSKSIMEGMTMALARSMKPKEVFVNVVYPGQASTAMTQSVSREMLPGLMKVLFPLMKLFFREDNGESAAKAAKSTIWAATTPELKGVSGKYFDKNCKEKQVHKTTALTSVQDTIVATITEAVKSTSPAQLSDAVEC